MLLAAALRQGCLRQFPSRCAALQPGGARRGGGRGPRDTLRSRGARHRPRPRRLRKPSALRVSLRSAPFSREELPGRPARAQGTKRCRHRAPRARPCRSSPPGGACQPEAEAPARQRRHKRVVPAEAGGLARRPGGEWGARRWWGSLSPPAAGGPALGRPDKGRWRAAAPPGS